MTHLSIIVTIDPGELQRLDTLIQQFTNLGMQVGDIQTATGTVTGLIGAARLDDLRRIQGVLSVVPAESRTRAIPSGSSEHKTTPPTQRQAPAAHPSPEPDSVQWVSVTISVAEECLGSYDDVVVQCEEVGLQVEQRLEMLGIITGLIDATEITSLKHIEGVAAVELARDYQIAPPNSHVQ